MVAPSRFKPQPARLPAHLTATPHILTGFACFSLFSFAMTGDIGFRWFWNATKLLGAGAAIEAAILYQKRGREEALTLENQHVSTVTGDLRYGYETQLDAQRSHYEQTIQQLLAQSQADIQTLRQQLEQAELRKLQAVETERERLALEWSRLQRELERLQSERTLLDQWHDDQQVALAAWEGNLTAQEESFEAALQAKIQEAQAHYDAKHAELESRHEKLLAAIEQELTEQKTFYMELVGEALSEAHKLKKPDLPAGGSPYELLARDVIRTLYEYGVIVKQPVVKPLTKSRFELSFAILPIEPPSTNAGNKSTQVHYVRNLSEAFKLIERDLLKPLRAAVPGCNSDPKVEPISVPFAGIRLTFDVSGIDWEAQEKLEKTNPALLLKEPSPEHFEAFIQRASHIGLFGGTRVGKTVAMNNIIAVQQQLLGGDAKLIVGDAKLSVEIRALRPSYLGAEECLLMLRDASDEVQKRIDLRAEDYRQNRPLRLFDHDKRLYLLDEVNEVISRFNNPLDPKDIEFLDAHAMPKRFAVSIYLLRLWRMGAELGILSLIAGQNLMANVLKMNIVDLENVGLQFLGGAISVGINYRCKGSEKTAMEQEFQQRRALREQYPDEPQFKYYAMFALANEKPYMAKMPGVGAYAVTLDQDGQNAFNAAIETAMSLSDADVEAQETDLSADAFVDQLENLYQLPSIEPESLRVNAPDFEALTPEAVDFLAYLAGKAWLDTFQGVRHYRRYWGERHGFNAEAFLQFLTAINFAGFGEFDDDATKWRSRNYPTKPGFADAGTDG